MRLKRTYGLLLSLGLLASAPTLIAGCSHSNPASETTEQPASADHNMAMADHSMMDLGPKDDEFDLRFVDGMILHHQGAIAMSEAALENSQRSEVKELAQNIIKEQKEEISQMQSWRQTWYPRAGSDPGMYHAQMGHSMEMSDEMQSSMRMDSELGKADDEFDLRFINGMIPHHEGALMMAEEGLKNSDRPEIKQVSNDILKTQQAEIDLMKQWKKDWYGQ